jgi:hypothetical protein
MGIGNPHELIDKVNAEQDRVVALKLRKNPRLLRSARKNLDRWMARDGRTVRLVFREWDFILKRLTAPEIADFLRSETPMAKRLRQSSPFASLLTAKEDQAIRRKYEKTRTGACG